MKLLFHDVALFYQILVLWIRHLMGISRANVAAALVNNYTRVRKKVYIDLYYK